MKTFPILILCSFLTIAMNAQIIIPFEDGSSLPTICGDTWTESGFDHSATNIPGIQSCELNFNDITPSALWLLPALARIDLSSIVEITKIEVDVTGHCEDACVNFRVFDTDGTQIFSIGETSAPGVETITFINSGLPVLGFMEIDAIEGEFHEIRIFIDESCDPKADISSEKGDIYIKDSCFGVILTSPNGTCFRVTVDDFGQLNSSLVPCP